MPRTLPRDIVVTTAGQLGGWDILGQEDVVSARVVAGTNIFSDIAASFSDIFGGRSKSYKKQLESITNQVVEELKEEAAAVGADAIVGLKIEHDEISGRDKSMLMVSATGTAVRATRQEPAQGESARGESARSESAQDEPAQGEPGGDRAASDTSVASQALAIEVQKQELLRKAEHGDLAFDEDTWRFLIENRVAGLAGTIRKSLHQHLQKRPPARKEREKRAIERGQDYFLSIDREVAKDHLYRMLWAREGSQRGEGEEPVSEWALQTIKEGQMLDFGRIHELLGSEDFLARKRALAPLVRAEKRSYDREDLRRLRDLKRQVENGFEKKGEVVEVSAGTFSSETEEKWQIEGGEPNPMDREYCQTTGMNIYGFYRKETKPEEAVEAIQERIEALQELL